MDQKDGRKVRNLELWLQRTKRDNHRKNIEDDLKRVERDLKRKYSMEELEYYHRNSLKQRRGDPIVGQQERELRPTILNKRRKAIYAWLEEDVITCKRQQL